MSTLYELTGSYLQLLDMMQDPDIDEQAISDTLEALDGEIETKADGYAKVMAELKGVVETITQEIDRLARRKAMIEDNIGRLKINLEIAMRATGKTKFKTDLFTFAIQKNGGLAPVIIDCDEAELPDDFLKVSVKPDIKKLSDFLKENPDCTFAHFGERGESLRIR